MANSPEALDALTSTDEEIPGEVFQTPGKVCQTPGKPSELTAVVRWFPTICKLDTAVVNWLPTSSKPIPTSCTLVSASRSQN